MSRLITAITLLPTNRHSPVAADGGQLAALSGLFVLGSVSRSITVFVVFLAPKEETQVTSNNCKKNQQQNTGISPALKKLNTFHTKFVISCDTKMSLQYKIVSCKYYEL